MSGRAWLVGMCLLASLRIVASARAEPMDLALSRLSSGECTLTTGEGPLALRRGSEPTLRPDELAWRKLATQLAGVIGPEPYEPVIGTGPRGFEVSLATRVAQIAGDAEYWARGARGRAGVPSTCAGRSADVRSWLVSEHVHVQKALPLGFTLGASVGKLFATSSYLVGADLKLALLEDAWQSRVPDFALVAAIAQTIGASDYALLTIALSALLSERFVVARTFTIAPFVGATATFTRARTATIDLTPNIDSVACREGRDAVCNAGGLGASGDDLAHDVRFSSLSLWRYRGFGGLSLRYRQVSLGAVASCDLVSPRVGDRGRGPRAPRQWTVSIAPTISF